MTSPARADSDRVTADRYGVIINAVSAVSPCTTTARTTTDTLRDIPGATAAAASNNEIPYGCHLLYPLGDQRHAVRAAHHAHGLAAALHAADAPIRAAPANYRLR